MQYKYVSNNNKKQIKKTENNLVISFIKIFESKYYMHLNSS